MGERTEKNLLHGVFCILRKHAALHAEGIDRVLQQPKREDLVQIQLNEQLIVELYSK